MNSLMSTNSKCERGSLRMTRDQIAMVSTPASQGPWHKPIPHIEVIDTLFKVLSDQKLEVINEEFSVNTKSADLFGVLDLRGPGLGDSTSTTSIGLRSNNMKKRSLAFVAGERVFVCDNLCFDGTWKVLKKKHTLNLQLFEEIRDSIDGFLNAAFLNRSTIRRLQERELSDKDAKAFTFDAFAERVFPIKCFDDVVKEYWAETPRHEEFAPRTAWSWVQAFTQVAKELKDNPKQEALCRLGTFRQRLIS